MAGRRRVLAFNDIHYERDRFPRQRNRRNSIWTFDKISHSKSPSAQNHFLQSSPLTETSADTRSSPFLHSFIFSRRITPVSPFKLTLISLFSFAFIPVLPPFLSQFQTLEMSRFLISSDSALADFAQRYIPANCTVRLPEGDEDPTINPRDGEIGIYTVFFEQAGLRLPLDPLLCDVLRYCSMSLCQLSPNGIRLVLGCSALNRMLGVTLTHREIFWCYSLCHCPQDSKRFYFRARTGTPDLVKCLTKSEKGYHGGMVVVGGAWDDGNIHRIRRRFYDHVGRNTPVFVEFLASVICIMFMIVLVFVQFVPSSRARRSLTLIPSTQLLITTVLGREV